ncbi:hypothetical protein BJ742DRAFT_489243 [Cladochytrium replicatum]|nr:hypothetical protein BJ742DRAFT_489243 [Cladochytrium replicatum]
MYSYFRNATGLPAMSLYTVACTEALLQGLNKYVTDRQLSPANTETWISNIRSSPSFRIEDMMVANPPFSLVTGDAEFVNRTFNSELQFSYFYNGTFVEFAIARPNGTLQQFRGIIYADGLTNPPKDMRISTSSPAALNQIVTIAVLVVVCAIFISIVITLCILFRRKRRVQPPAPFLEKSFKLHIDSPAKRATDILMQRRNSVEAPRKKTPFTLNLSLQRDKGKVFLTSEEVEVILDALTASSDRQFLPEFANTQHGADGAGLESVIDDETRAFVLGTVMATKVRASGPQSATNASTMAVFNSGRLNGANQQQQQQHPQTAHSAPSKLQRQSDGSMVDATSSLGKEGGPSGSVHSAPRDSGTPSLNIHFATTSRANVMKSSQVQNSEDKLGNRTVDSNLSGRSVSAPSQGQMLFGSTETQSRQTPDRVEQSITTKEISASDLTRIAECLEGGFNTWNFDMFVFTEITDGHPLYYSGLYLMQSKDILNRFRIDLDTYKRWLLMMEAEYHNHPYHNAIHAADVLHALHYLLIEDPLSESFTPIECFGGIIAAIGHDIDHPGLNNNFLVKARDPLAVLYSDISVNEYHHAAHVFLTTLKSKNNIFANLTSEEYEEIRRVIIRLILCTDMGKHFEYLTKFKTKLGSNSLIGRLETQENRLVIMEIAIKCADLSNPTKTPELARKWTSAIMEEFYRQGDRERDLGLPVSQFMDRHNTSVSKCQIGFIDILVAPLYEAWVQFNSNNEKCTRLQRAINKNRSQWAGSASNSQHQLTINRESGVSSAGKMSSPGSTQHSSGNLVLNRLVNANRSVQSVIRGPATIPQHPSASGPVPITQAGANSSSRSLGFGKQKSGSAKDSPRNSFIGSSHSSLKRSGNLGTSGRFHTGDREDRVEQNDLKS